jgi:hypothetical protein
VSHADDRFELFEALVAAFKTAAGRNRWHQCRQIIACARALQHDEAEAAKNATQLLKRMQRRRTSNV